MLQPKDLWERTVGEKVRGWDGRIVKELEALPGGRSLEAGTLLSGKSRNPLSPSYRRAEDRCQSNHEIMTHRYSLSNDTSKWFV